MTDAIYVYDTRTQIERPVFIVYDETHVEQIINALFSDSREFLFTTRIRMHRYEKDRYRGMGSR